MLEVASHAPPVAPARRVPKLGFAGVGWIGRNRLEAVSASGVAEISAITDPTPEALKAAAACAPDSMATPRFADLLSMDLDGIVIATPNALHAHQTIAALEAGKAVFCQKPLGRTAAETDRILLAAEIADRLLGVDLSYRFTTGMQEIKRLIAHGELGSIYAAELVFHNAYGPDKAWFYDPHMAGGGCLLDLGIHLLDLALWCLDYPAIASATSQLLAKGQPAANFNAVEDYAAGQLVTASGVSLQLACSWGIAAGYDARIELSFFGTNGGASFRNVNGSFYDFVAERYSRDRKVETLARPPDAWGGRAAVAWARQLAISPKFDPAARHLHLVASTLDRLYGRMT
jgi:predicted dehydrogenase